MKYRHARCWSALAWACLACSSDQSGTEQGQGYQGADAGWSGTVHLDGAADGAGPMLSTGGDAGAVDAGGHAAQRRTLHRAAMAVQRRQARPTRSDSSMCI